MTQAVKTPQAQNEIIVDGWKIYTVVEADEIQVWYQRPREGAYQPIPIMAVQIVQVSRDMVYTTRGHVPALIGLFKVYAALHRAIADAYELAEQRNAERQTQSEEDWSEFF